MATTIQTIETPKRARALDTSSGWQPISAELFTTADAASTTNDTNGVGAWTGNSGITPVSVSDAPAEGGTYAVKYTASDGGDGMHIDLNTYCTVGKTYEIYVWGKHGNDGTTSEGDNIHVIRLASSSSLTAASDYWANLYNPNDTDKSTFIKGAAADIVWSPRFIRFTHSANTRYLGARESGNNNDGSLLVDALSIKEVKYFPNNNHGQIYSGRALEFDGVTDFLEGPNTQTNSWWWEDSSRYNTTVCWMYINSYTDATVWFVDNKSDYSSRLGLILADTGKVSFTTWNGSGYTHVSPTNAETLNLNTWYRMVCIVDAGVKKFYINGVQQTGSANPLTSGGGPLANSNNNMRIGGSDTSNMNATYFNGMISDWQAWEGAWTQDDVTYDYLNPEFLVLNRSGTSLTGSNLKIWYPMQDGNRGRQSYITDSSDLGIGTENIDLTTGSATNGGESSNFTNVTTNSITFENNSGVTDGTASYWATGFTPTAGTKYKVTGTISNYTGTNTVGLSTRGQRSAGSSLKEAANGDYVGYFESDGSDIRLFFRQGENTATISNFSVRSLNNKYPATTKFYGDELMTNGDCEVTDPTTIQIGNEPMGVQDATCDDSTEQAAGASKSIKVTADSSSTVPRLQWLDGSDMGLVAGRTYQAFCYVYLPASQGMDTIEIRAVANNNSDVLATTSTTATASWTKISITFTDDDINRLEIIGRNSNPSADGATNNEYFYVDNISVKEVGIASGWTDADQQLDIPQTALQSYNELLYSFSDSPTSNVIVDIPDNAALDVGSGDFSISLWFRWDGGGSGYRNIISKGGWGSTGYSIGLDSSNRLAINISDPTSSASDTNKWAYITSPSITIEAGQWYHVVGTWDRTGDTQDTRLYVDGIRQTVAGDNDISDFSGRSIDNSTNFRVYYRSSSSNTLPGCVNEIALFKGRAIGAENVKQLYNDGKALDARLCDDASYITGYWRNNGLNTWLDLSDNSNNGTVTGSDTLLIPQGLDDRDSQGFVMNKPRNTSSLNFNTNKIVDALGDGNRVQGGNVDLGTDDFSVSFWAYKFRDWDEQWVVGQRTDSNNFWFIRGNGNNPPTFQFACEVGNVSLFSDADTTSLDGADYIEDWMHVTLTVDRSDTSNGIQWYINGNATSNGSVETGGDPEETTTSLSLSKGRITVGVDEYGGYDDHHFDGKIDGLLIYTKKLEAAEVKRNYNATKSSHRN
tara:strand:+ start:1453 stop:5076 length:3624 start_codon:yes stop_codon:yes gene_type:complete